MLRLPQKLQSFCENEAKVLRLPHKTTFGTLSDRLEWLECHKVPHLPRKTTWQPALTPSKRKGFAASPRHVEAFSNKPETRDETRGSIKTSIRAKPPPIFTLCSFKIYVFLRVFWWTSKLATSKIDVSCEASVNFHHISQNATPATEPGLCRHLTQPIRKKHATRHV